MRVSPQAVSKWERGLACPDLTILDDLADLLDVGIEELLTGKRQTSPVCLGRSA